MNRNGDHLCDGREAGDSAVIRLVFSVSSLEDQDRPPFEEPVVLLVPPVGDFPFDHFLHQLEDRFLDGRAPLDREGVN